MRALDAIVGLTFGLAGIAGARAADLPVVPAGAYSPHYHTHGRRAGMLVIYDDQPGVALRPYWRAPWRHRHYFPATGEVPEFGREENRAARGGRRERAESYRRFWSTSSAFLPDLPRDVQAQPWSEPGEPPLK